MGSTDSKSQRPRPNLYEIFRLVLVFILRRSKGLTPVHAGFPWGGPQFPSERLSEGHRIPMRDMGLRDLQEMQESYLYEIFRLSRCQDKS